MKVSIIAIGDELLIGQVTDTNSGMLARMMAPYGWEVHQVMTVADNADDIRKAVDQAFRTTDVILTTGGLGPTADDITKPTLCSIFGGGLHFDPAVLDNVKTVMAKRGRVLNKLTENQAIVPDNAIIIQNKVGTAPLFWFQKDGKVLVSMPGVPFETEEMFRSEVLPRLLHHFDNNISTTHTTLIVAGISESALAEHLKDYEDSLPGYLHLAYLPKPGIIRLRLDGRHTDASVLTSESDRFVKQLKHLVAKWLISDNDMSTAAILLEELKKRKMTVSTAESCTGGNIAHQITLIPGSSEAMNGSVVAYANSVKSGILKVDPAMITEHGAVSIPVAEAMAAGVRTALKTDISISTSGIAGPGGGTPEKPVGTVCIAVAGPGDSMMSETFHLPGSRQRVIERATSEALLMALKALGIPGEI